MCIRDSFGDDRCSRGHSALEAPGVIGTAHVPSPALERLVNGDRVVGDAAALGGLNHAVTDLDRLDGLDAHQRASQETVEFSVPVHVAAQTDGYAVGDHLDDAPERVTFLGGRLDLENHRRGRGGVETADFALVDDVLLADDRTNPGWRRYRADTHDVTEHVDADFREQGPSERPGDHARDVLERAS